jgi:hypothetical protein
MKGASSGNEVSPSYRQINRPSTPSFTVSNQFGEILTTQNSIQFTFSDPKEIYSSTPPERITCRSSLEKLITFTYLKILFSLNSSIFNNYFSLHDELMFFSLS